MMRDRPRLWRIDAGNLLSRKGPFVGRACAVKWKRASWVALIAAVSLLAACGNRDAGTALAKAGADTASTLAGYYNSLAQDTVDTWEMEAFYDSIQGIPFDDNSQKLYQDRIDALNRRAQMAGDLCALYTALAQLASYDASTEVGDAALRLSKDLKSIPIVPGSGVDASALVKSVAGDLASWKQSRDMVKGSRLIVETLEKIERIFQSEVGAYKSIAKDRGLTLANVLEYLIQKNMVITTSLLQKVPESLGLSLSPVPTDERTTKAVVQLARVRLARISLLSSSAADSTDHTLLLLIQNHRNFQAKKQLSISEVLAGLQRAQTYLDDISRLKASAEKP
jgi:hypothetical protein